ncbi:MULTISPECIES: exopolyphosphatase [Vibrio]|uniref:exopolyphosphatase n=1 Tax=Vibrio TaxID=662 RepID=UPI0001B949D8|nr:MULTISPECIES: exopolyphosphatase [Vibrio]EEX34146.1 exopolyphosphatase [Vibrio coralliilyticus ATCC BAA-450]MCM5509888.1 exopolyphosphatase [Vibrio sp. SCSIO 43169]MDE3899833.1 exopolyphosphatase [Vibrio sp. CC007]QFT35467.1 Exopolyphosphatase [Vibrio sp. THAF64]QGM33366.1 Exopolyphosphatase [Vibrio sp. THAF191d]
MTQSPEIRDVAAIDLGSNSFHMVVARVVDQDLQLVSRHKQRVRLAAGLDAQKNLDNASIERGLECLAMFAERLQGFEECNVRIAATHTLRQANNAHIFLQRAREVLPFPIEIIPGVEEARLIYLGVAHTQPESDSKLVVDIGGGSTEMIIGRGFDPELINSKQMGCVSYTKLYFANGKLSRKNFAKAILAAEQRLESIAHRYCKKGWEIAFGSSGTIKAIREVLIGMGYDDGIITAKRLDKLVEKLCEWPTIEDIDLSGLTPDRKPVFAAGVAILMAIFKDLKIDEIHFSEGALREGLLFEMEDGFKRSDIRMRTTENLASKHLVDLDHAARIKHQAQSFLQQVHQDLGIKKSSELFDLLDWSALLHEVGLSISLQAFHRHSAYILRHTYMPGFNREQQTVLAMLVRFQRKALKLHEMEEFTLFKKKHIIGVIRILRLAILLNGQRNEDALPKLMLSIDGDTWTLISDDDEWLEHNKLLHADLMTEQEYWHNAGWALNF